MLQVEMGRESEGFVSYIEKTLYKLSKKEYDDFLDMFDNRRISRDGV